MKERAPTARDRFVDWRNVGALFQRELKVASRLSSSYWLRVVGAGVVLYALASIQNQSLYTPGGTGQGIFRGLNWLLAGFVWLVAPLMTSDCLSREKREGTLPLLFLTSMKPLELVLAKSTVHFARAGMLLLAAVPVMLIPTLFGGLSGIDILRAVLLHIAALFLALASGLLASALTRYWVASRLMALALTLVSGIVFVACHIGVRSLHVWLLRPSRGLGVTFGQLIQFEIQALWLRLTDGTSFWANRGGGAANWNVIGLALAVVAVAVVLSSWTIWFASRVVARSWRDVPALGTELSRFDRVLRPFGQRDVVNKHPLGDRDPMMWIQTKSRRARLERVLWVCLAFAVFCAMGMDRGNSYSVVGGLVLLLGVAVTACSSFSQEIESGAMELLLVTPIPPRAVLLGRLKAILWGFFPALMVMSFLPVLAASVQLGVSMGAIGGVVSALWVSLITCLGIVVMGVVGMALSVSGFPFPGALFLSLMLVVGMPLPLLRAAFGNGGVGGYWTVVAGMLFVVLQFVNVFRSWTYAERQLSLRTFLKS